MQKNSPFFDDLAKMATGAFSSVLEMRHEVERMVQQQFDKFSSKMDFVSREEFEVVRAMAQKAREENAALRKDLDALKPKKTSKTAKKAAPKKTTAKKTAAKKTAAKKPAAKKTTAKK